MWQRASATLIDDDISGCLFLRNRKMVGNETMSPLLKRMPKAQAEDCRTMYETH